MNKLYSIFLIIILIISTSIIKTSTRELESKIFNSEEKIKILLDRKELILLQNNYLSSPKKLNELKKNFLKKLEVIKYEQIKYLNYNEKIEDNKIIINRSNLDLTDFDNNKFKINLNRVAFFILIFATIILYSTRVIYLSSKTYEKKLCN